MAHRLRRPQALARFRRRGRFKISTPIKQAHATGLRPTRRPVLRELHTKLNLSQASTTPVPALRSKAMVRFRSVAFALVTLVPKIAPGEPSSAAPPEPVIYAISPNPASAGAELA